VKYYFKNITVLNVLLLIAIISMVDYSLLPFFNTHIKYVLPSQRPPAETAEGKQAEFSPPSPSDYTIISEENLFHPQRIIPPEKKVEVELPKPDFILYGTMVSDDLSIAFLEDLKAPRNTPGRGKRQVAVKRGDTFSGFTLKEIEQDKIVMVRGEEKMMVAVVDPQKPKTRASVATTTSAKPGTTSASVSQQQKQPVASKRAQPVQKAYPLQEAPDQRIMDLFQK
jgi:hypothetical protein